MSYEEGTQSTALIRAPGRDKTDSQFNHSDRLLRKLHFKMNLKQIEFSTLKEDSSREERVCMGSGCESSDTLVLSHVRQMISQESMKRVRGITVTTIERESRRKSLE